jgi:hypothetical protein
LFYFILFFLIAGVAVSAKVYPANKSGSHSPTLVETMNLNGSATQLNGTPVKPERNGHLPPINGTANGVVSNPVPSLPSG